MKYIEIKNDGYTHRYDFDPVYEETAEGTPKPVEDVSSANFSLRICLDLLRCCYGKDAVRDALKELPEIDY